MDIVKVTLGKTIKTTNGSYAKYEGEVTKEIQADSEALAKVFAMVRSAIAEQTKLDGVA